MNTHGFLRVAAAAPMVRVADCNYNAERMLRIMKRAEAEQVRILLFPELSLTGYTCGDLFHQDVLRRGARAALDRLVRDAQPLFSGLAVVGVPLEVDNQLYNCAAVFHRGRILGVVPKSFIPNYKEFYEVRWFAPAAAAHSGHVIIDDEEVPFGADLLFEADGVEGLTIGVEICEDLWVPIPQSAYQALSGATLLLNLSASNDLIAKAAYRRQLVLSQSARCLAGYAYTSCGVSESTTDLVFGGHCLIAENGILLAESQRFQRDETLLIADVDLDRLQGERLRMNSFGQEQLVARADLRVVGFEMHPPVPEKGVFKLKRLVDPHPFVPSGAEQLQERCEEVFQIQVAGLAKRLEHVDGARAVIGVSGGLDSTLALLVACKTMDVLGRPRSSIHAFSLPGFGTSRRSSGNARALMEQLGATAREVDVRGLCLQEWRTLGHQPFGIDLTGLTVDDLAARLQQIPAGSQDLVFENVQARMRTSILMNSGFVIGTSDLSELALGWCTYNGDHMSMYNPNVGIPKSLVTFLVRWIADHEAADTVRKTLFDVLATDISPELLPADADGQASQATESIIGPYELHDFFLFHVLRHGSTPEKILFLAEQARFDRNYDAVELRRWLRLFIERFFANQYKRSCLPDGPKVGSVSLSPRGDWRMPSDAGAREWLAWLKKEHPSEAAQVRPSVPSA